VLENNDHAHIINSIAKQRGATPVHLDEHAVSGLRNLHKLIHNEDVGHDFSGLKSFFSQPHVAHHLKTNIEQKKANGGVINDYINTLKQHGNGLNSPASLVPDELVHFLDDSYSLGTTNPNTGYKEYHLGKMFDSLGSILKPVKDSYSSSFAVTTPPVAQAPQTMPQEQPREPHAEGDMIGGSSTFDPELNIDLEEDYRPPFNGGGVFSEYQTRRGNSGGNPFAAVSTAPPSTAPSSSSNPFANSPSSIPSNPFASSSSANASPANPPLASAPSSTPTSSGSSVPQQSWTNWVRSGAKNVIGKAGEIAGGLGGQLAAQQAGHAFGAGIPFVGGLAAPVVGNIAGNAGYAGGAYFGRKKADAWANNLLGTSSSGVNSNAGAAPKPSMFPSLPTMPNFGQTASNIGSGIYNATTSAGKGLYDVANQIGKSIYGAGQYAYNNIPSFGAKKSTNPFDALVAKKASIARKYPGADPRIFEVD